MADFISFLLTVATSVHTLWVWWCTLIILALRSLSRKMESPLPGWVTEPDPVSKTKQNKMTPLCVDELTTALPSPPIHTDSPSFKAQPHPPPLGSCPRLWTLIPVTSTLCYLTGTCGVRPLPLHHLFLVEKLIWIRSQGRDGTTLKSLAAVAFFVIFLLFSLHVARKKKAEGSLIPWPLTHGGKHAYVS